MKCMRRTAEVDEYDEAIDEIKSRIDLSTLKKHTGGIIFCHGDFIESGMVEALCAALPFPVIGMTSLATANPSTYSQFDLNLTVLTSDEVSFAVGITGSMNKTTY